MWIARNEDGTLTLHKIRPQLFFEEGIGAYWTGSNYYLPTLSFPEVTFENSPMEVELKLDDSLKLAHQISNKELREILSQYPDDAMVAVEYCNINELRYHKDRNLITID